MSTIPRYSRNLQHPISTVVRTVAGIQSNVCAHRITDCNIQAAFRPCLLASPRDQRQTCDAVTLHNAWRQTNSQDYATPSTSVAKVLVVDADRELAAILSFTLERAGFAVSTTADARSASRTVVEDEPLLVLSGNVRKSFRHVQYGAGSITA